MRKLCQRFGLPVYTEVLRGTGALMSFLKRRGTLAASILAFALVSALMLGRIWRVDVAFTGNAPQLGEASALFAALDGLGVHPGIRGNIDTAWLAGELSARVPGCSFIGVQRQGVRLLVTAAPEVPAPELYALDDARDLYARLSGIVVSVNARAGTPCVHPGDAVRRGQLLIRGEERDRDDAVRPIAALGEVVVRTWFTGAASLPGSATITRPTGNTSADTRLSMSGYEIPIVRGRNFSRQSVEVEQLPIVGLYVPVALRRELHRELCSETVPVDGDKRKAQLASLSMADASARMTAEAPGNCVIAGHWVEYEYTGGGTLTARAVIEITTDTATTREALNLGG